ncbi:FAD-linked oxidoreductase phmC [Cladobotryum mycophilum]|uniref:FAD-linked oxidoreductase phmC n=1 Tax=Cladobotryum mycophilum TaxID=491253 RepID=A0ABR0SVW3_9HYPO
MFHPITAILALIPLVQSTATTRDWRALNASLQYRLQAVTPIALPCFSTRDGRPSLPQPQACSDIQDHYTNAQYRVDNFASYVWAQAEVCNSEFSQQCLLDPTDPHNTAAYTNVSCNQGALPSYYVEVETAKDVTAAFRFASTTGTTISIKNSGHDYIARSSGPGSLALWTRKLQSLTYHDAFVPTGCRAQVGRAISTGAGVNFDQVYTFAHQNNVTFLGGSGPTVGASGGWAMTGGHGILSRAYGLGIDRILEFEVVTPDGKRRIANSCQNEDLFWALRGGGGSTFGVVLSSTHRVEPAMPVSVASISIPSNSPANISDGFLNLVLNSTLQWANEGWGGYQGGTVSVVATPLLSLAEAQSSMGELARFAKAHGGSAVIESLDSFYEMYTKYILPAPPVADMNFNHNWMIPSRFFATADGRQKLQAHLNWMTSVGLTPGFLATTPYLYSGQGGPDSKVKAYSYGPVSSTSSTSAWRKSAAILTTKTGWAFNAPIEDRKKLARTLREASDRARKLAPDGGSYANEAHPWVNNWQEAFWGDNYAKLSLLKWKWDPWGLLGCWHCVGSEMGGPSDVVGGRCLGRLI